MKKLAFLGFSGLQRDINKQKRNCNQKKSISGIYGLKEFLYIHNSLFFSASKRLNSNPTIANGKFAVNKRWYWSAEDTPKSPGVTSTTANHADVRLISIDVNTSASVFKENNLINFTLTKVL